MSAIESVTGPKDMAPEHEQYAAQERFNHLRDKLEVYPYAIGTTDDIHEQSEDGLYVSPAIFTREDELPKFTEMHLLPGAFIGAGDSYHGVMFAQIEVADGKTKDWIDVAIKPYNEKDQLKWAIHEHDSLLTVKEIGFDTLAPLAVFKDGDRGYLITEFRPDLLTMDNEDWTVPPEDEEGFQKVKDNLIFIAESLGGMQAKGLFRGDDSPKNFAKSDIGEPIVIDIEHDSIIAETAEEHARLLSPEEDGKYQEGGAIDEIKNFCYLSTRPLGINRENMLMPDAEPERIFHVFKETFIPAWKNALLRDLPKDVYSMIDIEEIERAALSAVEESLRY